MTDYGEPWNCKSQLWSKRRERLVDCEGVFDRNGDLLADCVMGLDYPENAECMDRLVIDRIVACVNFCQGLTQDELHSLESVHTTAKDLVDHWLKSHLPLQKMEQE